MTTIVIDDERTFAALCCKCGANVELSEGRWKAVNKDRQHFVVTCPVGGDHEYNEIWYYRSAYDFVFAITTALAKEYWAPEGAEFDEHQEIEAIWWDHDLGEDGGDIMDCINVLHMLEDLELGSVSDTPMYVHSQNPVGADNIINRLSQFCTNVKRVPLPELQDAAVLEEAKAL